MYQRVLLCCDESVSHGRLFEFIGLKIRDGAHWTRSQGTSPDDHLESLTLIEDSVHPTVQFTGVAREWHRLCSPPHLPVINICTGPWSVLKRCCACECE